MRAKPLSVALWTAREKTQSDPMSQHRGEGDRGDITLIVLQGGIRTGREKMRARVQLGRPIDRPYPDECRSVGMDEAGPLSQYPSDVVFLGRHHAAQPQVGCSGRPIDLVAGDMTFFDTHDAERFSAIGNNSERFACRHDGANDGITVTGWHRQLIGKLTREGYSEEARRYAPPAKFRTGKVREPIVGNVDGGAQ
jgi:hypothetical protein